MREYIDAAMDLTNTNITHIDKNLTKRKRYPLDRMRHGHSTSFYIKECKTKIKINLPTETPQRQNSPEIETDLTRTPRLG